MGICNTENSELVIIHELGHIYWFEKMTDKERQEFKDLAKTRYVSKNAEFNHLEDFAETFAYIVLKENGIIPNRYTGYEATSII